VANTQRYRACKICGTGCTGTHCYNCRKVDPLLDAPKIAAIGTFAAMCRKETESFLKGQQMPAQGQPPETTPGPHVEEMAPEDIPAAVLALAQKWGASRVVVHQRG
jgi:hypothetical protein